MLVIFTKKIHTEIVLFVESLCSALPLSISSISHLGVRNGRVANDTRKDGMSANMVF